MRSEIRHLWLVSGLLVAAVLPAGCALPVDESVAPGTLTQRVSQPVAAAPAAQLPRATGTPEDARRHMVRGLAAVEMAKGDADLVAAEDEFRMATDITPDSASAWYNRAEMQKRLGRNRDAMESYRRYLALAPDAADAAQVRDEIIKIEFIDEQRNKIRSREGLWMSQGYDGAPYRLRMEGQKIILRTLRQNLVNVEAGAFSSAPSYKIGMPEYKFVLEPTATGIGGTLTRSAFAYDKCSIPAEQVPVEGKIQDGSITLHFQKSSYTVVQQVNLLVETVGCRSVEPAGMSDVTLQLAGPLPQGGIGVEVNGYGEVLRGVHPGFDAATAGLKAGDRILEVDGKPVFTSGWMHAVGLLRGEPGSSVELTVLPKGKDTPVLMRVRRGVLPDGNADSASKPILH